MSGWRYFATRVNGDGTETLLADAIPLHDPEVISDLSGPGGLAATVAPELARLKGDDGLPILKKWSTAIYAEKDGQLRGGGIIDELEADGPVLALSCIGFAGYPRGMPYMGEDYAGVAVDPLDVVRRVWDHLQGEPGGDLGLVVDNTTSPVRIGKPESSVEFTTGSGEEVAFDAGPVRLADWQTHGLGKLVDDLAVATPFEYRERHSLDGETLSHRLELGYPRLGRRLHELRFVVGENVFEAPAVTLGGEEPASGVLVLGAGEGRDMVRGRWTPPPTGMLRRVSVVESKDTRSKAAAARLAERETRARNSAPTLASELTVIDHGNAPIGSYSVGDEILVQTPPGWSDPLQVWSRIVSLTIHPDTSTATLTTVRAER